MDGGTLLADPGAVLVGLGALAGLFAARGWFKVFRSVNTAGQVVAGPSKSELKEAALLSSIALGLASAGYLVGALLPAL